MAGGGTAEGMKVSDVFILIGISVLVAGFIIHSWVAPEVLESEDGESAVIEKSALLLKNDKLVINLDVETGDTIYVTVNAGDEQYQLIPLSADSSEYEFTAKESGEYQIQIQVNPSSDISKIPVKLFGNLIWSGSENIFNSSSRSSFHRSLSKLCLLFQLSKFFNDS